MGDGPRDEILDHRDRVVGFELGADDYLVKPFAFSELLARVRAVHRRVQTVQTVQVAATAGHVVHLFDVRDGAAADAIVGIGKMLSRQVEKGKLDEARASELERLLKAPANCPFWRV